MSALHLAVSAEPIGATVFSITTNAPVGGALSVGERVLAVDGRRVSNACGLDAALALAAPGTDVELRVERARYSSSGAISYAAARDVAVPTSKGRYTFDARRCTDPWRSADQIDLYPAPWLGVDVEDAIAWHFPVKVAIDTADIGGPSAGLAMTLGIIDSLSKVPITGDLRIAATGEIAPDGLVGDVGGVAEKTIAVEHAGATVFLVPPTEIGAADSTASKGLRVLAVSTLAQALADIRRLGGSSPVLFASTAGRVATS